MIQYQILQTNITWTVWEIIRRITNEILGVWKKLFSAKQAEIVCNSNQSNLFLRRLWSQIWEFCWGRVWRCFTLSSQRTSNVGHQQFFESQIAARFLCQEQSDDQFIAPPSQEIFKTPCLPYVFIDTVFLLYIRAMSQTMKSQKFLKALPKR